MNKKKQVNYKAMERILNRFTSITDKLEYLKTFDNKNQASRRYIDNIYSIVENTKLKHFPDTNSNVEFTYWFLGYNAEQYFNNFIGSKKFQAELRGDLKKVSLSLRLKEIEKREQEAIDKMAKGNPNKPSFDSQSSYNENGGYLDYIVLEPETYSKAEYIETLRILEIEHYKNHPTKESYRVHSSVAVKAYFTHNLLKPYLKKLLESKQSLNSDEICFVLENDYSPKSILEGIWLAEPKISVQDFLKNGMELGIWNNNYEIITSNGSLYSTGKTLLGSLSIALRGWAISDNTNYKEVGKVFCKAFKVPIKKETKQPYKMFSDGNPKIIRELKRAFKIKK